jgi:hypothetical protein
LRREMQLIRVRLGIPEDGQAVSFFGGWPAHEASLTLRGFREGTSDEGTTELSYPG